jgi:uncharacterized protein (TIGR02118 family)
MSQISLIVLYPHPSDVEQFSKDYQQHLALFHQHMQVPLSEKPYSVLRFVETPLGKPAYYQMFSIPFPSEQALQQAMFSPQMQLIAADAVRISSGGAPVVMVGKE